MRIMKTKDGTFRLYLDGKTIEAHFSFVSAYLVFETAVTSEELEVAIGCMAECQHDTAYFNRETGRLTHTADSRAQRFLRLQLEAIKTVRDQYLLACERDSRSNETRDALIRLQTLMMSLPVDTALDALDAVADDMVA